MADNTLYIQKEMEYLKELKKKVAQLRQDLQNQLNLITVEELILTSSARIEGSGQDMDHSEVMQTLSSNDPDQPQEEMLDLNLDKAVEIFTGSVNEEIELED